MSLLWKIIRLPFVLWIILGAGMAYNDYVQWQDTVLTSLDGQIQGKNAEYANLKRETGKAEDFRRRKEDKLRELQELSARLDASRQQYPSSPNIPQLLKDLADVADRTGLEFHSFKPMAEKREEFVIITPIEVRLRGTYVQIMSFLDTAANLRRAIVAEKLLLENPLTREGSVSLVQASASLVTYSIDDTASVSPAAPMAPPVTGGGGAPGAQPPQPPPTSGKGSG